MDAATATTLAETILSSPVAGAAGLAIAIVLLSLLKQWLPASLVAAVPGKAPAHDPEPTRAWHMALDETADAADAIGDTLKMQLEILRRQVECLERLERTIATLVVQDRGPNRAAASPRSRPGPGAA